MSDDVRLLMPRQSGKATLAALETLARILPPAEETLEQKVARLERALGLWACPSCDGSGTYWNRGASTNWEPVPVECRKCRGLGLHPIASEALGRLQPAEEVET